MSKTNQLIDKKTEEQHQLSHMVWRIKNLILDCEYGGVDYFENGSVVKELINIVDIVDKGYSIRRIPYVS